MPLEQPIASTSSNWYLLTVRAKKREVFLKYLQLAIGQNHLEELILEVKVPKDSVYEDIVLLNLSHFRNAYTYLQKVECFQNIERKPLPLEQVSRMLGI